MTTNEQVKFDLYKSHLELKTQIKELVDMGDSILKSMLKLHMSLISINENVDKGTNDDKARTK